MIVLFKRCIKTETDTQAQLVQLRQRVVQERISQRHKGIVGGSALASDTLLEVFPIMSSNNKHFWDDVPHTSAVKSIPGVAQQLRECLMRYGHPDHAKRSEFGDTTQKQVLEPIDATIVKWQETQDVVGVRVCAANVNLSSVDECCNIDDDSAQLFCYEQLPITYLDEFAACYVAPESLFADAVKRGYTLFLCGHADKDGFLPNTSHAYTQHLTHRP